MSMASHATAGLLNMSALRLLTLFTMGNVLFDEVNQTIVRTAPAHGVNARLPVHRTTIVYLAF